ncbi:3-oxoacyl-[acyl-carrier-protein] reductase [Lactobacillus nasalidis]|uniref:3-oxoacyl-[acyl-carrier-protein] reductase n=1 Tax=Lactobacillus nasalidis TaxID=2797258 RepID=A0ABQ3W4W8_9LACO|nr:3-oxoacyl-ACP reductase family protein [Lactobacillus nasalidis]GHV97919.1 3-oxoacyl-[acyl-carrier-protein] reductase [Lactobacillus nasalidis]GHV99060.1 3-oxoacyl-[acyl-carrier-protein] reductase [Lactobacillus nasalidis]GHW00567.1 3-oxoacyl-[acyl-carrier-protein] reductase [Lactobacillus nasalidis]
MDLKNKRVLITGSTQGIGAATALAFAKRGCQVLLNGRRPELPAALAKELEESGAKFQYFSADVSDEAAVKQLFKEVGDVDIVVNNAGITRDQILIGMKLADFDQVIRVNLRGSFMVLQKALKKMLKKRSGVIINMASVVGQHGNAGQANYAASKAGVIALTQTAAKEAAQRGVRVNAIAPGMIASEMTAVLADEVKEAALKQIPLARFGQAGEVAQAAVFLAENDYVTGQTIVVDGGMTI